MKQWEDSKKDHYLTLQFFGVQGINVFASGRPSKDYYAVRRFLGKLDDTVLNLFHEYLETIDGHRSITMPQLFNEARRYATESKITKVTSTKVNDYMKLLEEWK